MSRAERGPRRRKEKRLISRSFRALEDVIGRHTLILVSKIDAFISTVVG